VTIFIWAKAAYGFLSLLIATVSRDDRRLKLIREHTRPLFINLMLIETAVLEGDLLEMFRGV
jgi:hypothetical protein